MADSINTADKQTDRDGGADSIVSEAKVRFERAKAAYNANRARAVEDTKFVMGDSDNGWQWPAEILLARRQSADKRPCLTVNVTAQHCNQVINNIRQNRPQCSVKPGDADASRKTAEILGGLIRQIQQASNADVAHDTAAEHAIYGGEGYWRIVTEYESPKSFNQRICIKPIENPQLVYVDPFCGLEKLKAQWGFVFEDITKEECKRLYGKDGIDPASWQTDAKGGWVNETTVRIADYYYCVNEPDTLYLLQDGSTILESEATAQGLPVEALKAHAAMIEAQQGGKATRQTSTPKWKYCKLIGGHDQPVDEKDWAGDYLPIISVIGKELNVNGEIVRKGVVRDLKDPARMVNYSYSAAIETVALQNKIPYIAPAEAIEGYEQQWANANQSTASYLPFNAFDENGNAIPKPERQQPAVMPQAQVSMLQLSVEEMRAASGMQNANFGIKSEAASGVGIQRLKVQGETATFHFPDNLARALHDEAVVLMNLIPKVMDTRRAVQILGIDGKAEQAILDPEHPQSYGEVTMADVQKVFNPNIGTFDVVIDTGPSYQTQRQEAAAALTELASRNPQLMQVAGDIIMKAYDFPFSEQLAERLTKTLPPGLADDKGKPQLPPEVEQQMQQMQQHVQQLGQALQGASAELAKLKGDQTAKFNEVMVKAYAAETDRITALGGAMSPQMVQQLVMQTIQEVMERPDPLQGEIGGGMDNEGAEPMPQPMPSGPPPMMGGGGAVAQPDQAPQGAIFSPAQPVVHPGLPGTVPPPAVAPPMNHLPPDQPLPGVMGQ
jgi:hypothetical protein